MMAAQVARACAVFQVDEIVVFNDGQSQSGARLRKGFEGDGYTGYSDPDDFLYHVLSYLETPPHLRKSLFPMHPNLRTAGAMPSLDMPHHLRANEWCQYREGVTVPTDGAELYSKRGKGSNSVSTLVDCGLPVKIRIPAQVPPGSRVTVDFGSADEPQMDGYTPLDAKAVAPDTPREETGYYWGYSTRMASSLSAIFTECPYDDGYDLSLGTSERGISLASLLDASESRSEHVLPIPSSWRHMVIVFGGVAGLEVALKADKDLTSKGVTEARDVFDYWVNLVQQQGSRTIRTEEAVWLGLMGLRSVVQERQELA
jgi:predicted SPOUT superfamily RNA methylase MTH1